MESLQLIGTSRLPGTPHEHKESEHAVLIPWHRLCDSTRVFLKHDRSQFLAQGGQISYDPAKEESHDRIHRIAH